MNRAAVNQIATFAFAWLALGAATVHWSQDEDSKLEPELELDCQHRQARTSGTRGTASDYVLRLALLDLSVGSEAVLDAVEFPLTKGQEIEVDMGCRTSTVNRPMRRLGFSSGSDEWQSKILRSRSLPASFGGITLHVQLQGTYHGNVDDLHLITLREFDGHVHRSRPGSSGGGSCHLPVHATAMAVDTPIARVYPNRELALFAIVTRHGGDLVAEPGSRESWRQAFHENKTKHPIADRSSIQAAVKTLEPRADDEAIEADAFLSYGPLLDLLTAAYALRDREAVQFAESKFAADGRLLLDIINAGLPPSTFISTNWFLEHVGRPWERFIAGWMAGRFSKPPPSREPWDPWLRLLETTSDRRIAQHATRMLIPVANHSGLQQFLLLNEVLGESDAIRENYRRVRAAAIRNLQLPWSIALRSPTWTIAFFFFPLFLAILLVCIPLRRNRSALQVSRFTIFLLAMGSFVTLCSVPLKIFALPLWWILAIRWLREPVRHGLLERGFLAIALTLVSIDALQSVRWYINSPLLGFLAGNGSLFAWITLGMLVVHDGRWRAPGGLLLFLWATLGINIAVTLSERSGPIAVLLLIVGVLGLFVFWARGAEPLRHP